MTPVALSPAPMTTWNLDTLRALDLKYAKEGVHLHQRPFRAATEILGNAFSMGVGGNPEVQKIMAAYESMLPEVNSSWPGMGIGSLPSSTRSAR